MLAPITMIDRSNLGLRYFGLTCRVVMNAVCCLSLGRLFMSFSPDHRSSVSAVGRRKHWPRRTSCSVIGKNYHLQDIEFTAQQCIGNRRLRATFKGRTSFQLDADYEDNGLDFNLDLGPYHITKLTSEKLQSCGVSRLTSEPNKKDLRLSRRKWYSPTQHFFPQPVSISSSSGR